MRTCVAFVFFFHGLSAWCTDGCKIEALAAPSVVDDSELQTALRAAGNSIIEDLVGNFLQSDFRDAVSEALAQQDARLHQLTSPRDPNLFSFQAQNLIAERLYSDPVGSDRQKVRLEAFRQIAGALFNREDFLKHQDKPWFTQSISADISRMNKSPARYREFIRPDERAVSRAIQQVIRDVTPLPREGRVLSGGQIISLMSEGARRGLEDRARSILVQKLASRIMPPPDKARSFKHYKRVAEGLVQEQLPGIIGKYVPSPVSPSPLLELAGNMDLLRSTNPDKVFAVDWAKISGERFNKRFSVFSEQLNIYLQTSVLDQLAQEFVP